MKENTILEQHRSPAHWKVQCFRWVIENRKVNTNENLPLLGANIHLGVTERFDGDGRAPASEDLSKYKKVEPGDIIMNPLGKPHGSIGRSETTGITSPAYWVLRVNEIENSSRYFHYLLRSEFMIEEFKRRSKNLPPNQFDLPWEDFREISICLPPIAEQSKIAEYLDIQVKVINQAIESKNRVLELSEAAYMAQLRQLLTPPKDLENFKSQGWATKKVAWMFKTGSGTTPTSDKPEYFEGSIPWVNSGDLNDSIVTDSKSKISNVALEDFSALRLYPKKSLLVAMYGATVGKTGILGISACVNQAVCVLESIAELSTSYAHYWFLANRQSLIEQSVGGGQPNINQEIIRQQRISFPSSDTQAKIMNEIQKISKHRTARSEIVMRSIESLAKYKDSLITSAVTGSIKVISGKKSA